MSRHPEIVWAQRSDKVFLTVELPDAKNPTVKLEPDGKFVFHATLDDTVYEADLQLFDKVNVEESKVNAGSRHTFCVIKKQEKGWWKRLLKGEGKTPPFIKVDWNKWVDEDEEADSKLDSFDFSSMGDFSKFKTDGDDAADNEDEDLPELEKESS